MAKKLIIVGASGHGKVISDIAKQNKYRIIEFLDDNDEIKYCGEYSVVGKTSCIRDHLDSDFVVGIGNGTIREKIQKDILNLGGNVVSLIHSRAVVSEDVKIGKGTVIMAGAVVNPGSVIGEGVIINTCSSVDHDCVVEDFSHISVGSHLSGTVIVGKSTWIGAGTPI